MGKGNRSCKFLRCVTLWTGGSENEDDGPGHEVGLRGKEGKWIGAEEEMKVSVGMLILRGMWTSCYRYQSQVDMWVWS